VSMCKRVQQGIECPECGYPAAEALYYLKDDGNAVEPITGQELPDPGHTTSSGTFIHTILDELIKGAITEGEQPALCGDWINHNTLQRRVRLFSGPEQEWNVLSIYMNEKGQLILDIEEAK